ncbi:MAG: TonB-dependent receptor plug domain-containing protein [Methylococcales bacterium]
MKNHKNRPLMLAVAALFNTAHAEGADLGKQVLPEVKVKAAAEKEPEYKADTSSTGLKVEAAIRDIPQSVSVVKKELIKSQNAFSLRDALKNVSGLTIAAGEDGALGRSRDSATRPSGGWIFTARDVRFVPNTGWGTPLFR